MSWENTDKISFSSVFFRSSIQTNQKREIEDSSVFDLPFCAKQVMAW